MPGVPAPGGLGLLATLRICKCLSTPRDAAAQIDASWPRLHDEIFHCAVRSATLDPVLTDLVHQGRVGDRVEHRLARPVVNVAPPQKTRHHENVVALPIEAAAGDLGLAVSLDHDIHRARGLALEPGFLAGAQELRRIGERREQRFAVHRIDELQRDPLVRIPAFAG